METRICAREGRAEEAYLSVVRVDERQSIIREKREVGEEWSRSVYVNDVIPGIAPRRYP